VKLELGKSASIIVDKTATYFFKAMLSLREAPYDRYIHIEIPRPLSWKWIPACRYGKELHSVNTAWLIFRVRYLGLNDSEVELYEKNKPKW
jgi:hypothetical protein